MKLAALPPCGVAVQPIVPDCAALLRVKRATTAEAEPPTLIVCGVPEAIVTVPELTEQLSDVVPLPEPPLTLNRMFDETIAPTLPPAIAVVLPDAGVFALSVGPTLLPPPPVVSDWLKFQLTVDAALIVPLLITKSLPRNPALTLHTANEVEVLNRMTRLQLLV